MSSADTVVVIYGVVYFRHIEAYFLTKAAAEAFIESRTHPEEWKIEMVRVYDSASTAIETEVYIA